MIIFRITVIFALAAAALFGLQCFSEPRKNSPAVPPDRENSASDKTEEWFSGTATLETDGTIVVRIASKEKGQPAAHGYFRYPTKHPDYTSISEHAGNLAVGVPKKIEPWPHEPKPEK
jgi:hypothetical protein